jgi:octaprenyl-diphosphate synthase
LKKISSPVRTDLQCIEAECTARLHSQGAVPEEFVDLINRNGSRLLRPALLLLSSRLCGYVGDVAIHYATAVELIHRATLLHRTIRTADVAPPTDRWQEDVAVLLGDYLYVTAMQLALVPDRRDIVQLICEATGRTFEGELYHLSTGGQSALNDDYFNMSTLRTAPLFAACGEIGARLGRVDAFAQRALSQYGYDFGLAIQLLDEGPVEQASARAMEYATAARAAIAPLTACAEHDLLLSLLDTVVAPSRASALSSGQSRTGRP